MKKTLAFLMVAAMLVATTGCANGPIRSLFRGKQCNTCNAPAANPSFGYGYSETAYPVGTDCSNCVSGNAGSPAWIDSGSSDPYVHGSNYGGATINPPVFDSYSNPSYGGTIVPPGSSGTLPDPGSGG